MQRTLRMKKELVMLETSPHPNVSCWAVDENLDKLGAQIVGAQGTPYEMGIFKLDIVVPQRYPFEPPHVQFVTPIYHPNIDSAGRICLDILKMPPAGSWTPSINISTVLTSILVLMSQPNPNDPLLAEVAEEFRYNRPLFEEKARTWTKQHAMKGST